jgi:hypothetical protein
VAQQYLDALSLIERLHRLLLDVIKDEFERLGVWKSTRFKHCYCSISVKTKCTQIRSKPRGYYQGSNVSHNLKKLVNLRLCIISVAKWIGGPFA